MFCKLIQFSELEYLYQRASSRACSPSLQLCLSYFGLYFDVRSVNCLCSCCRQNSAPGQYKEQTSQGHDRSRINARSLKISCWTTYEFCTITSGLPTTDKRTVGSWCLKYVLMLCRTELPHFQLYFVHTVTQAYRIGTTRTNRSYIQLRCRFEGRWNNPKVIEIELTKAALANSLLTSVFNRDFDT